MTYRFQFH